MRVYRLFLTSLAGAAMLVPALRAAPEGATSPAPAGGPNAVVLGFGQVSATDDFGGFFPGAGQIELGAIATRHGSTGSFSFSGRGAFAAAWGACPYDPRCIDYPNTNTTRFTLRGRVTNVVSVGDSVAVSGTLTETDYGTRNRVVFYEADVPFVITADEGSREFVLQFCAVPPFTMKVEWGLWFVKAGANSTSLFQRPEQRPSPLPCHAPTS